MPTSVHVGETARDRTDFCRCFKTGAAVLLHNDWIVAHSTYRNTPSEPCAPARTRYDTRPRALIGKTVRSGQTETNSVRAEAAEIASAAEVSIGSELLSLISFQILALLNASVCCLCMNGPYFVVRQQKTMAQRELHRVGLRDSSLGPPEIPSRGT